MHELVQKSGRKVTSKARPLHVLIVEDSEDDALLIVHRLRKGGYEPDFQRVQTPEAMREALRKSWDMVISDHSMPGFSAPDALSMANEYKPDIPFIIVSGLLEDDMAAAAVKAGARCCLKKDQMEMLLPIVEKELRNSKGPGPLEKRGLRKADGGGFDIGGLIESQIPDSIWIADLQLDLKYVNNAIAKLSGYTAKEALDCNLRGLLSGKSFSELRRIVEDDPEISFPQTTLPRSCNVELQIVRKDGATVYADTSLTLFRNGHDGNMMLLGIMRDTSNRKYSETCQHEIEVRKLNSHLMWSMWQLAGAIAHEINNPLAVVSGYAQTLLKKDLPPELTRDIKGIYDSSQRIADIVKRMLQFTSRENAGFVGVSVNSILEVSLGLCVHDLRQDDIGITVQLESSLPKISGNSAQLQQVFVHLITNARIEMKQAHGKGRLYIQTRTLEDAVSVTVQDDGPGIDPENLQRIFEPFFTTREAGKGQGLGLSLCYAIVDAHGGYIYAMSRPGGGATFIVNLPVYKEAKE